MSVEYAIQLQRPAHWSIDDHNFKLRPKQWLCLCHRVIVITTNTVVPIIENHAVKVQCSLVALPFKKVF